MASVSPWGGYPTKGRKKEQTNSDLEIFGDTPAGEERAAEAAEFIDGFGAFVVGIVNQSEILVAQKDLEFAGGKGCGCACFQMRVVHEWQEDMRNFANAKPEMVKGF